MFLSLSACLSCLLVNSKQSKIQSVTNALLSSENLHYFVNQRHHVHWSDIFASLLEKFIKTPNNELKQQFYS